LFHAESSGKLRNMTPPEPFERPDALFLSDVHHGAEPEQRARERERRLYTFLERRAPDAKRLFVLGDLFDFWFEYGHAIPRRPFELLRRLAALREKGTEIVYLGGNHDFWAGPFLRDELGATIHDGPARFDLAGRRLSVMHGDGLARGDLGYKMLKAVLRNRWTIAAYRALHPDLGIPFALWVSRVSRTSRDESKVDREWLYRQLALPRFAEGADAVLTGHYHHPTHFRREGRDFIVLGDWVKNFTYAALSEGALRLERWTGEGYEVMSGGTAEYPAAPGAPARGRTASA
jgi:UDP-2,3-diacylglucosamine hydrolase